MPPEKEENHVSRFIRYAVAMFMAGLILAVPMQARIVRIDIQSTSAPASDGYVTITGRAYGEVDPTHPLNAIIQDIKLASGNARGMVEYSMDFTIFKPSKGGQRLVVLRSGQPGLAPEP